MGERGWGEIRCGRVGSGAGAAWRARSRRAGRAPQGWLPGRRAGAGPCLFRWLGIVWVRRSGRRDGARVQVQATAMLWGAVGGARWWVEQRTADVEQVTAHSSHEWLTSSRAPATCRMEIDFFQDSVCVLEMERARVYTVTGGISFVPLPGLRRRSGQTRADVPCGLVFSGCCYRGKGIAWRAAESGGAVNGDLPD
jgi:hypothetical protein